MIDLTELDYMHLTYKTYDKPIKIEILGSSFFLYAGELHCKNSLGINI